MSRHQELIDKLNKDGGTYVEDRLTAQEPLCMWGENGTCCKNCFMGPCRIIEKKQERGVCGATKEVICARNLVRWTSAGSCAHVEHAREIILALYKIATGEADGYQIKDPEKLKQFAKKLGIKNKFRTINAIAKDVALEAMEDYRRQHGLFYKQEGQYLNWLRITATQERLKLWENLGIMPENADIETSRALHITHMGNDADEDHLMLTSLKLGITDGYGGMHMATDFQDMLFGTPTITKTTSDMGVIKEDYINIAVHGHVPLLSEKVVEWAQKLEPEAKKLGAKGINIVGVCCTGNEILMRLGIPSAAHVMQAELVIATGAIEAMVVDTQCVYPSVQDIASCYHTKIITTMVVRIPGAERIEFHAETADENAQEIVKRAIAQYPKRDKVKVHIPQKTQTVIGGFSAEAIATALSKLDEKQPFKPLIDNIKQGNIKGIAAVVGCRNPKMKKLDFGQELMKKLLKENVLIVSTGCMAHTAAQAGMMNPEYIDEFCGEGLSTVLKAIGKANNLEGAIPPVLYMGSCVDNSRVGTLLNWFSDAMGVSIDKLPVVGSAPEWMSEKSYSIATFFLANGVGVHINPIPPVTGAPKVSKWLTDDVEKLTGGKFIFGETVDDAFNAMMEHIECKRKGLGI